MKKEPKTVLVNNGEISRPLYSDPETEKLAKAADHAMFTSKVISAEEWLLLQEEFKKERYMWSEACKAVELKILSNIPFADKDSPFKFQVLSETIDVRPLFNVFESSNTTGLAATIDSLMLQLITNMKKDDFNRNFKDDYWLLRQLRNAIIECSGGLILDSWRDLGTEGSLSSDCHFLQNRLNNVA